MPPLGAGPARPCRWHAVPCMGLAYDPGDTSRTGHGNGTMRMTFDRVESYARQVDESFRANVGIAYSFLKEDLERSAAAPRLSEAIARNLPPEEFVERVRGQFGLREVASADAIPFNRRVAALAAFAAENPDWSLARDGAVYREGPGGVERLSPSRDVSGRSFGFAASVSTRATLDVIDDEAVVEGKGFINVAGGSDIGMAVQRLEETYERRLVM